MAVTPATAKAAPERDPIAEARALVAMAIGLGTRTRNAHRLGQVTDRKASLYVNTLVRHTARLLQSTVMHDVPVLRASANGPGGNVVHYVIRHDHLDGPPGAMRFLTVGSDSRLRCCVVSESDGSRVWADYDVSTAPEDLALGAVLDSLSALVSRLEQAVTRLEARQLAREAQLESDIAAAKARLSGMTAEGTGPKRHAESEEPVRPWTRHVPGATAAVVPNVQEKLVAAAPSVEQTSAAVAPAADQPSAAVASDIAETLASEPVASTRVSHAAMVVPTTSDSSDAAASFAPTSSALAASAATSSAPTATAPTSSAPTATAPTSSAPTATAPSAPTALTPSAPAATAPPPPAPTPPARRGFKLSRLENAI